MPSLTRIAFRCLPLLACFHLASPAAVPRPDGTAPSSEKQEAKIAVNVFGAVTKPGTYSLSPNSTLLDALGAAGGWTSTSATRKVSIVSGPAGEKPVVTIHDVDAILHGKAPNPKLENHDSVVVDYVVF